MKQRGKKPTLWRYFVYRGRYYYNHSMLFDERLFLLLVDNEHCSSSFDYWHLLYLHIIKKILMPQSVIHEMLYMKHPTRLKILQGVFLCSNIYVTSPETGAEDFSEITDTEAEQLDFPFWWIVVTRLVTGSVTPQLRRKSRTTAAFSSFCNHVTLKR